MQARDETQTIDPADTRGEADELQPQRVGTVRRRPEQVALDEVREDARHRGARHPGALGDLSLGEPMGDGGERTEHRQTVCEQRRVDTQLEHPAPQRPASLRGVIRHEVTFTQQIEQTVGAGAGDVTGRGDDARRRRTGAPVEELEDVEDARRAPRRTLRGRLPGLWCLVRGHGVCVCRFLCSRPNGGEPIRQASTHAGRGPAAGAPAAVARTPSAATQRACRRGGCPRRRTQYGYSTPRPASSSRAALYMSRYQPWGFTFMSS